MQIAKRDNGDFELRLKDATVTLGQQLSINDFVVPGPGEYEVGGVMTETADSVTRFYIEDVTIGLLAPRSTKLGNHELEELGAVDVVFFTIGADGLSGKEAAALIGQIEAPLMIPIAKDASELDELASQAKTEDQTGVFKLTRSQLPAEGSRILLFR